MATLLNFAKEMERMAYAVRTNIPRMQKRAATIVVTEVAYATPVDTGQAAGNWITTVGQPASQFIKGGSSANASVARVGPALAGLKMGEIVHIVNNAPYIELLNQGRSQQAPALFVEAATLKAIQSLDRYNILVS
jgi:hypothetical protein